MNRRFARALCLGILLLAISPVVSLAATLGGEAASCCCHGSCPKPTDLVPTKAVEDCCQMSDDTPQQPVELPAPQLTRVDDGSTAFAVSLPIESDDLSRAVRSATPAASPPEPAHVPLYTRHASFLI